jgi:hypothetical protein
MEPAGLGDWHTTEFCNYLGLAQRYIAIDRSSEDCRHTFPYGVIIYSIILSLVDLNHIYHSYKVHVVMVRALSLF